jgi:hypothetical protein
MRRANPVIFPEFHKKPVVRLGDLVQWTSNGVYQFETPRRVRAIQTHEGEEWIFVQGTLTGLPLREVSVMTPTTDDSAPPPEIAGSTPSAAPVVDKEREWLRGSLSTDTSYRLLVSGHVGPNELGNLIKLLQAQKAVLEDSAAGQDSAPVAIGTTLPESARLVSIGQNERPKRIS